MQSSDLASVLSRRGVVKFGEAGVEGGLLNKGGERHVTPTEWQHSNFLENQSSADCFKKCFTNLFGLSTCLVYKPVSCLVYKPVWFTNLFGLQTCLVYKPVWFTNLFGLQTCLVHKPVWFTNLFDLQTCLAYKPVWYSFFIFFKSLRSATAWMTPWSVPNCESIPRVNN